MEIVAIIAVLFAIAMGGLALWLMSRGQQDKASVSALEREVTLLNQQKEEARKDGEQRLQSQRTEAEQQMGYLKADYEKRLADQKAESNAQKAQELETIKQNFNTQLKLAREEMRAQFEQEMKERSNSLKEANKEQMEQVVGPLQKELESLHELVDQSKVEQGKSTAALEASIKAVFEHDKERDKTTQSLADALKNRGKVQGDWGEQVLENILRDSGLREGEEFEKQYNVKNEENRNDRPDIVVKGADGSCIIIDSKVSLTAYTDYVGAETEEERKAANKENHDSIWRHVVELSDKKYQKTVKDAMPIVLMFVPNEGSYILAMNYDPQLGTKAYNRGVLIINPTNLMVVLKLMFLTWQHTRQEKNNQQILLAASKIFDKYSTFADSYLTLGSQLANAKSSFDKGLMQLREGKGNLSKQIESLLSYGVTPTKQLPDKIKSLDVSGE